MKRRVSHVDAAITDLHCAIKQNGSRNINLPVRERNLLLVFSGSCDRQAMTLILFSVDWRDGQRNVDCLQQQNRDIFLKFRRRLSMIHPICNFSVPHFKISRRVVLTREMSINESRCWLWSDSLGIIFPLSNSAVTSMIVQKKQSQFISIYSDWH